MRALLLAALLVLPACGQLLSPQLVSELTTTSPDTAREFIRECLSVPNRSVTVRQVIFRNGWAAEKKWSKSTYFLGCYTGYGKEKSE
jgi:hypothetical protein